MSNVDNNLSKLKMIGARILGYNTWGIVFHLNNSITFKNCETDFTHKFSENSKVRRIEIREHFISIDYLSDITNLRSNREALFVKGVNRNIMWRMSGKYQSYIGTTDYDSKLIMIKKTPGNQIILINYKGNRVTYEPCKKTFWGEAYLRKTGDKYLLVNNYDSGILSEIDVELQKELN